MRPIWLAVIVLIATAYPVDAAHRPKLEVNGGVALPAEPASFSDGYSVGFGGGIGLEFPASSTMCVIGRVDFTNFGMDRGEFARRNNLAAGATIVGGETSILYASGTVMWHIVARGVARPYLVAGGGWFRMDVDDITVDGTRECIDSESVLGLHAGGGLVVGFGTALNLFVEVVYVRGLTDIDATVYVPVRAGIAFDLTTNP